MLPFQATGGRVLHQGAKLAISGRLLPPVRDGPGTDG